LSYFSRYVGLFGDRLLSQAKPNQVLVSLAHSSLFDDVALARVLTQGPLAAAWLDSVEPGTLDPGKPLRHVDTLQVTPRVSSVTQTSLLRGAWAVASRIDEVLAVPAFAEPSPVSKAAAAAADVLAAAAAQDRQDRQAQVATRPAANVRAALSSERRFA
jgi:D-3-phosphoglycerate dehydrogenase / 2-oxoglutarate reductase